MAQKNKLLQKLNRHPNDFTWDELVALLKGFGWKQIKSKKTGGSRRRFVHDRYAPISLHQPHPGNVLKSYVVNVVIEALKQEGLL